MKESIYLSLILLFFALSTYSQTFTIKGKVSTKDSPIAGCSVVNETKSVGEKKVLTITNQKGEYSIEAEKGDKINFYYAGFTPQSIIVNNSDALNIKLEVSESLSEVVVTGFGSSSVSIRNFWVGAKIGYNFIGNTDDDFFVGSATIALNLLDNNDTHHSFGIIGNFGNFKFNKDTSDTKNIQKVAQSINGLSIGVGYTHETSLKGKNEYKSKQYPKSYFREFIQSGVRLTTFTKVGKDSSTANLGQSMTTGGVEFEQTGFKNGGSITASMGVSLYLFDKDIYKKIFDEEKSRLVTLDFTIILPISKNMGFFVNGTFAKKTSAAYILGVILKP